jgi:hypothetical protein
MISITALILTIFLFFSNYLYITDKRGEKQEIENCKGEEWTVSLM